MMKQSCKNNKCSRVFQYPIFRLHALGSFWPQPYWWLTGSSSWANGDLFWWNFELHKKREISWLAELPLASQRGQLGVVSIGVVIQAFCTGTRFAACHQSPAGRRFWSCNLLLVRPLYFKAFSEHFCLMLWHVSRTHQRCCKLLFRREISILTTMMMMMISCRNRVVRMSSYGRMRRQNADGFPQRT